MKKVDEYLKEAIKNIRDDRAITSKLLVDAMTQVQNNSEKHQEIGQILAKYVETLQRSNEQLVKITGIISKQQAGEKGLSEEDKNDLFDLIKENG